MRRALRRRRSHPIRVDPAPPNKSNMRSPAWLLFTRARSTSSTGFHRGVKSVGCGLLLFPQRGLRLVAVPGIFLPRDMAIEDRLMLELIPAKPPREGVLAPDDLTTDFEAGFLQDIMEFTLPRGGVADVQGGTGLDRTAEALE